MKSVQEAYRTSTESLLEYSILALKLERNQKDVRQLRNQLNSYIYEPKTYSLFERMESLKSKLDELSETNREIIATLRERKKPMESSMNRVKQQIREFNKVQQGVEDYMEGLRYHY